jgi:phage baseplate assembly protein W
MANYYGYTSIGRDFVDTAATDQVLIRADLINHFNTRLGERLMNPEFGCIIWDYIFDPFTDEVRYAVIENLQGIIESDPRIVLRSLDVAEYEHGLQVELAIAYADGDYSEDMVVTFDSQSGKATA